MHKTDEVEITEQDIRLKEKMSRIKHKIIVISGKGGVGKSTVAVNLAYELAEKGNKVGILDVDMHGPNVAKMLGINEKIFSCSEWGIMPAQVTDNLVAVSLALLFEDQDQPIIWRGPLKMLTIKQLLADVNWGSLDYLIVDSPPGTGDEPLSVCQLIPDINGAVVVTTPQDVAILDSRKSVLFAKQLNVPFIGIVENMSGFVCPECGEPIELFGSGGGEKSAEDLNVPFLGRIPVEPEMVKHGDSGQPFIHFKRQTKTAQTIEKIVKSINSHVEKKA